MATPPRIGSNTRDHVPPFQAQARMQGGTNSFFANLPTAEMHDTRSPTSYSSGVMSQVQITTPGVCIKRWGADKYEAELFEGELAFIHRSLVHDSAYAVLNLRITNNLLREFYNKAVAMVAAALEAQSGIDTIITHSELVDLLRTPTAAWETYPPYKRAITSSTSEAARSLIYLNLNDLSKSWNFYGTFLGQMQDDKLVRVTAFVRSGLVREMVNVWGPTATPGAQLYLVWKRIRTPSGEWGPYAITPFAGHARPEISDITFEDTAGPPGSVAQGIVQFVGTVIFWAPGKAHPSVGYNYAVDAGTVPPSPGREFRGPSNWVMRVAMNNRRGLRSRDCL